MTDIIDSKFLDIDEIETLRNALNFSNRHTAVRDELLTYFPANKQYFYDTERAFDIMSEPQIHTLRDALISYSSQMPPPKDLENVAVLLNELECKKHVTRKTHITIIDGGETGLVTDCTQALNSFEIDFEYCIICDLRKYDGRVKPRARTVDYLEDIAENGSFNRISIDTQTIDHREFVPLIKEIKNALDIPQ